MDLHDESNNMNEKQSVTRVVENGTDYVKNKTSNNRNHVSKV